MLSVLDMFSIGIGPSSSHTVGPMRAACEFAQRVAKYHATSQEPITRIHATLYGSLAQTGLGHGTDRAVLAGLEGKTPETVNPQDVLHDLDTCSERGELWLNGTIRMPFARDDIEFDRWHAPGLHPNRVTLSAFDTSNTAVLEETYYSIGGGFIATEEQMREPIATAQDAHTKTTTIPFDFCSAAEMIALCEQHQCSIADLMWANENALRPQKRTEQSMDHIWRTMRECVSNGCTSTEEMLPGGLHVRRRAPKLYERMRPDQAYVLDGKTPITDLRAHGADAEWAALFAMAVNEENAGGGRIVTAPTNGAAGIIPAVLHYYWLLSGKWEPRGIYTFLLTASAIGYLFKRNASISGAEVGCQGEVGSACSMAAGALCAVLGGTPRQVENAAEIGIEHNLGLTCDPIGGLVQIPCIERNAMATNTAINAARMALLGDGSHIVSLDSAIKTMKDTGLDMMSKYKETSQGGLAVNVTEC